jgi:hypothetical protein
LLLALFVVLSVVEQTVVDGDTGPRQKCEFFCDGDTLKLNGTTYFRRGDPIR